MSEDIKNQVAIVVDEKVMFVLNVNDDMHYALTSSPVIVDLGLNPNNIDSTYKYNPRSKEFYL